VVDLDQVSKEQVEMAVLAVVLVVEVLMQTVPEVAMHRHLVKVMMVEIVVAVELPNLVAEAEAEVLVQQLVTVGRLMGPIIATVVTVEQVQLLQSQVHL
jgi:hypothetical protein